MCLLIQYRLNVDHDFIRINNYTGGVSRSNNSPDLSLVEPKFIVDSLKGQLTMGPKVTI